MSTAALSADDEVVVGFAASYSGWMQAYSQPSTNAALIAIDDINAKGGLLGKKLKAVMADAKTDRVEGAKAGQQVLNEGAEMVAGPARAAVDPACLCAQNRAVDVAVLAGKLARPL